VQIIAPHIAQAICTARRSETSSQLPKVAAGKAQTATAHELRLVSTR